MNEMTKIAMFVVGAVILFGATVGLYFEQYYATLGSEGLVVTGKVSHLEVQRASASAEVTAVVAHLEFSPAAGKRVQSVRALSPDQARILREGGHVAIRYLPQVPQVHEIVAFSQSNHDAAMARWLQYLLLLFIGGGAIFWVSETPRLTKPRLNLSLEELEFQEEPTK